MAIPPEAQAGLTWLQAQVGSTGALSAEAASLATTPQARTEALQTLTQFGAAQQKLSALIAAGSEDSTEHLARRVIALTTAGFSASQVLAMLGQRQNADGGFGDAPGKASNVLDTSWTLIAFRTGNHPDGAAISRAVNFLAAALAADGGFSAPLPDQSSAYVTAYGLLALDGYRDLLNLNTQISKVRTWLTDHQSSSAYGDSMLNALAVLSLSRTTSDSSRYIGAVETLRASQAADGSWGQDVYVTSLAVRALSLFTQLPTTPMHGSIAGRVIDSGTLLPLAGASVNAGPYGTQTNASGEFILAAVLPGSYTVTVAKGGYGGASKAATVAAGAVRNLGNIELALAAQNALLRGQVRDASTGAPIAGAQVALSRGGSPLASALTDGGGAYEIGGLTPGGVEISVSKSGYATAGASASLAAGTAYTFSPGLYLESEPQPISAALDGTLVDEHSNQPIAGASVTVGSRATATDAAGRFVLENIPPGPASILLSASGYSGVELSGALSAGINHLGTVKLRPAANSVTITGQISDSDGAPVPGATVSVTGTGLFAVANAQGIYTLSAIPSTAFVIRAESPGYLGRSVEVTVSGFGSYTVDVTLEKNAANGLELRVSTNLGEYLPFQEVEILAGAKNTTAQAKVVSLVALILNDQQEVVAEMPTRVPLQTGRPPEFVSIPADGMLDLIAEWYNLSMPAGQYKVLLRARGTDGVVVGEASSVISIAAYQAIGGGIEPDPPITQANTAPVSITAKVSNQGNLALPGQNLNLEVVLDKPDMSVPSIAKSEVTRFLAGTPLSTPRGAVYDAQGNLYVGNISSTPKKILKITPAGQISEYGTINSNGTIVDMDFDPTGRLLVAYATAQYFRIPAGGGTATAVPLSLTSITGFALDGSGNIYVNGTDPAATAVRVLMKIAPNGAQTTLARNGLSQPFDAAYGADGKLYVTNFGDNSITRMTAAGGVEGFLSTGLNRPQGITLGGDGNLYVANSGTNEVLKITPAGATSVFASGLSTPAFLDFDSAGNLYVANGGNNTVAKILPNGSVSTFAATVSVGPSAAAYDGADNLYVLNNNSTITKVASNDEVSTISGSFAAGATDMVVDASGALYVANAGTTAATATVSRVAGGVTTTYASSLGDPTGLAFGADGHLYVTELASDQISRITGPGVVQPMIKSFLGQPQDLAVDAAGTTYILNNSPASIGTLPASGIGTVLTTLSGLGTLNRITTKPDGGIYLLSNSNRVTAISASGQITAVGTYSTHTSSSIAVDAAGVIYLGLGSGANSIMKVNESNQLATFVTLVSRVNGMASGVDGNIYAALSNGTLQRVTPAGTVTQVAGGMVALGDPYQAADGTLYVTSNARDRIYKITPAGAVTTLISGIAEVYSAVETGGSLIVTNRASNQLRIYSAAGQLQQSFTGFDAPTDIVWAGDRFIFKGTSVIASWVPGENPKPISATTLNYLAWTGSKLLGTTGSVVNELRFDGTLVPYASGAAAKLLDLQGIAVRSDGSISVTDKSDSRVATFNAAGQLTRSYMRMEFPQGLTVDASGRVYVTSATSGTVLRYSADGATVDNMAEGLTSPRGLAITPAGNVLVASNNNRLSSLTPAGVITTLGTHTGSVFRGVATSASGGTYLVDSNGRVASFDGTDFGIFALGMGNGAVVVGPDGAPYISGNASPGIVRYENGQLNIVESSLASIIGLTTLPDGRFVANTAAQAYVVSPSGESKTFALPGGVNAISGMARTPDGRMAIVSTGNFVWYATLPDIIPPPPAGTVVYTASDTIGGLPVDGVASAEFGQWTPQYGGEYVLRLASSSGIAGQLLNNLHVGPNATAVMTADRSTVAPGSAPVQVNVKVEGADFSSLTKVDPLNLSRVASTIRPDAMGADGLGNLYFSDGPTVTKVKPDGTTTPMFTVATGSLAMFGGIPVDSQQNLYVATGTRTIVKVAQDGTSSVLATMPGSVGPESIALDSHGNLFIATTSNTLYKMVPGGVPVLLPLPAMSNIYGITIDGADNIYVLDHSNVILRITPDLKTEVFLSDSTYEYEGFPLAGDCANNLLLAPYTWTAVGQSGEEHTLVQIFGKTRNVATIIDGNTLNPKLDDFDHLVYDRFSGALLVWTDVGGNPIYRLPITCGALDVDLHISMPAGQSGTGFTVAPTSSTADADGGTEYVWNLKDVTNLGSTVQFDTVVNGLVLGDTRSVVQGAFLEFKNSFTPTTSVNVPVTVPTVSVIGQVDLDVTTDRLSYPPMTEVLAGVNVQNLADFEVSGTLTVELKNSQGVVVAQLLQQGMNLPAQGLVTVRPPFNTGTYAAAGYTLFASFSDSGELLRDTAEKNFTIGVGSATPTGASSRLTTDKARYGSYDSVQLNARVTSTGVNASLRDLVAIVTISGPSGAVVTTLYRTIDELAPAGVLNLPYVWDVAGGAVGGYTARLSVENASRQVLTASDTTFEVQENVNAAVTGQVMAQSPVVVQGQTQVCTDRVANSSARPVSGLQIRRVAALPAQGITLDSDARVVDIGAQNHTDLQRNVATGAIEAGDVTCALEAFVGGQWKSLAFASFKVTPEPYSASLGVAADRPAYDVDAQAQITAGVHSLMQYRSVRGAILYIEVTSPSGAVVLAADLPLDDLPPGEARALTQAHAFSNAAEGDYTIRAVLSDALGQTIATAESGYRVRKSLALALSGTVLAEAESVEQGVDQRCTDRLANASIYPLADLRARHVLSRSEPPELLQSTEFDASIPADGLYEQEQTVQTGVLGAGDYNCALEYQSGNAWLPLAATPFRITPETARVTADLVLDRVVYDVGDTLTANTAVASQMQHRSISGAHYALEIRNSAGAMVYSDAAPLPVLDPQASLHPQSITAANFAEGAYVVRAIITAAEGSALASDEAAFNIRRSVATALSGSVSVSGATVQQGAPLSCSDSVSNASIYPLADVTLRRSVLKASNSQVVSTENLAVSLDAGASLTLATRNVATASLATGSYRCVLEADTGGSWKVLGAAEFAVELEPLHVALDLTLDKANYGIADQVLRKVHIQSQAQIRRLENATLHLDVTGPAGNLVHAIDIALSALQPGAALDVESIYGYSAADEGRYTVKATLLDGTGNALQSDEAQYEVRKTTAQAIAGSVTATRPVVVQGESQTCTDQLVNSSRYAVSGLQVRQVLERIDQPQTISTTPLTLNVPANGETSQLRVFGSSNLAVGSYACRLDALLGGQWTALGSAGFLVNAPASTIHIDASLAAGGKGRVLVLLDEAPGNGSAASSGEPPLAQQRVFIETLLRDAGWSATIVTSSQGFATELRSGEYAVYAILSESIKLDGQTQQELLEAVYRGEGMFEAGSHDQRNSGYDDALGVKYKGNWPSASGVEILGSGVMQPGYGALQTGKKALRADLAGATRIGRYLGVNGNGASDAAVTQYLYGNGRSLYFGYDLLAEASKAGATSAHANAILQGLELVQPAYASSYPAQVIPVRLTLQNRGSGVQGRAMLTLPAGAQPVDLGGATVDGSGKLVWTYLLAEDQSSTLTAWVRLPNAAGTYTFGAQVQSGSGSSYVDRASASLNVSVTAKQALAEARTLAASSNSFKKVKTALDNANTAITQARYADAQQYLLDAASECIKIGASANTLRQMIDQAIWVNGQKL